MVPPCHRWYLPFLVAICTATGPVLSVRAELKTWDGKHSIARIDVRVVYFVPRDRTPLADWRDRVSYFCRRMEQFHQREFGEQSVLSTQIHPEPFRSGRTTEMLRVGDGDAIFFQTLREVDAELTFGQGERNGFPILLVLSDINWRPLDDFFRLSPKDGQLQFEGQFSQQRHYPGAASGGARATYLADQGKGWGLVSADGWRVPYIGSDCVVYHEGVGHTVGLPHPQAGNGSVMSMGQYRGWISESWLDEAQKERLGWTPPAKRFERSTDLFSTFRALPAPPVPKPDEEVVLKLDLPDATPVRSCRVRIQTDLSGPWVDMILPDNKAISRTIPLGRFDRPTPVSYRVDVKTEDDRGAELWGYFQVREEPGRNPLPPQTGAGGTELTREPGGPWPELATDVDLLSLIDVERHRVSGQWKRHESVVESPHEYGARIEVPYETPAEYRLTVVVEPLDEPNALILGQRSGENRFLVLVNYAIGHAPASALENVDGRAVDQNATTIHVPLLKKGRPAQIICTVRKDSVRVSVDGREIIDWQGDSKRLSLSDYWRTPHDEFLFIGAYDCRYRFSRLSLTPLSPPAPKQNAEDQP